MKSYNGLFDAMKEIPEIEASIDEAAKNKTKRKTVRRIIENPKNKRAKAEKIQGTVESPEGWRPPHHETQPRQDGSHKKIRMIQKPRWDDEQIIHHMLMRQFRPIVERSLYKYACGSIPGRGTHYAMRAMKRWRDGYKGQKFYVAELDIRHFYDTVDTERLKARLEKIIRDRRYKDLLFRVIDGGAPGLPKGFYTSPWLAHFLLTPTDHYIAQQLKPDHYLRYMDNFFLFARNKKKLHAMVEALREHLLEQLGLAIKDDWQVYRFEGENRRAGKVTGRAINCLGFVIHNNRVCLRKTILKRIRAKALRMHRNRRCRRIDAAAMISYLGYLQSSDTYNYYKRHIKPNVSIQYCKRRISALAKKSNKEARNAKCPNGTRYTTAGQNSPQSWTPPAAPPPCTNAGISTRRPAR